MRFPGSYPRNFLPTRRSPRATAGIMYLEGVAVARASSHENFEEADSQSSGEAFYEGGSHDVARRPRHRRRGKCRAAQRNASPFKNFARFFRIIRVGFGKLSRPFSRPSPPSHFSFLARREECRACLVRIPHRAVRFQRSRNTPPSGNVYVYLSVIRVGVAGTSRVSEYI